MLFSLCVGFSWGHPSDHSCELGCLCYLWLSPRQTAILWCIFFVRLPRGPVMWSLLACSSSYQQCSFVVETRWHSYIACGYTVTCHVGRYSLSSSEDQQRFKQCQLTPKSVNSIQKGCNAVYRQQNNGHMILYHMHTQKLKLCGNIRMKYGHQHDSALLKICSDYFQSINFDLKKSFFGNSLFLHCLWDLACCFNIQQEVNNDTNLVEFIQKP